MLQMPHHLRDVLRGRSRLESAQIATYELLGRGALFLTFVAIHDKSHRRSGDATSRMMNAFRGNLASRYSSTPELTLVPVTPPPRTLYGHAARETSKENRPQDNGDMVALILQLGIESLGFTSSLKEAENSRFKSSQRMHEATTQLENNSPQPARSNCSSG